MCIEPVGDGAIRVTTGRSGADIRVPVETARRSGPRFPIMRAFTVPSLGQWVSWLRAQLGLQSDRAALWAPVAFGTGAAAYLGLKAEPPEWFALVAAAVGVAIFV